MFDFLRNLLNPGPDRMEERLGEYLDGTLSPRARSRLEATLAQDPALREQLRQMRAIRAAMRRLPRRRAPRSFTLSPDQVGAGRQAPAWSPYPVLRAATVVVTVMLAALLVFDLGFYRGGLARPAGETALAPLAASEPAAATRVVAEEAVELEVEAPAAAIAAEEAEPSLARETPADAADAAAPAAPPPAVVAEAEAPAEGAPEQEVAAGAVEATDDAPTRGAFGAQGLPAGGTEPDVITPTLVGTPPPAPSAAPVEVTPTASPTPVLAPALTSTAVAPVAVVVPTAAPEAPTPSPAGGLSPLIFAEIGLGLAALGLGLLAWLFRRRS